MAVTKIDLDAIFKETQSGLLNKSISQSLTGLRTGHRRINLPDNRSNQGYVFMTRPQLNLSAQNLIKHRPFYPLLSKDPHSLASWIRGTLDPRWAKYGNRSAILLSQAERKNMIQQTQTSQVDVDSPFINAVTNNLISLSGFPDIDVASYTGEANRIGASYQLIDGIHNLNRPVDITLSLKDTAGSPIYNLFRILATYPSQIYKGTMTRYEDFIIEDTIDYNVRIYRILISTDGETIHSIASTFPGFIQGVASGARYDYNHDTPYSAESVANFRFMFSGVIYDDPALIDDFNRTVDSTNRSMRNRTVNMVRIPRSVLEYFSYEKVYPYINIDTYTLEWWTSTEVFKTIKEMKSVAFKEQGI